MNNSDKDFSDLPHVSGDFLFAIKKLARTSQKYQKGGPYTKNDRNKRRNAVFHLHFDYGYSAVKISEMLVIDRHTINSDIKFWYGRLSDQWETGDIESWFLKQIYRFETQRTKLMELLTTQKNLQDKLSIIRLVLEIDSKIANIILKGATDKENVLTAAEKKLNEAAKEYNLGFRFIQRHRFEKVSKTTHEKIEKLIVEDKKERERNEI